MGSKGGSVGVFMDANLPTIIGTYGLTDIELGVFLRLCYQAGQSHRLEVHLQGLADSLGYTKTHVGRFLKRFQSAGLIEYEPSTNRHSPGLVTISPDVTVIGATVTSSDTVGVTIAPDVMVDSDSDQGFFDAEIDDDAPATKKNSRVTKGSKTSKTFSSGGAEYELAKLLLGFIQRDIDPKRKAKLSDWARHIDLLHRVDERPFEDIEKVIRWLHESGDSEAKFWCPNILSTRKLRDKFPTLVAKMGPRAFRPQRRERTVCPDCHGAGVIEADGAGHPCKNPKCEGGYIYGS